VPLQQNLRAMLPASAVMLLVQMNQRNKNKGAVATASFFYI